MKKISHNFIAPQEVHYKVKLGYWVASSLSGFVAGAAVVAILGVVYYNYEAQLLDQVLNNYVTVQDDSLNYITQKNQSLRLVPSEIKSFDNQLLGSWAAAAPEKVGSYFINKKITFNNGSWSEQMDYYQDAAARKLVLSLLGGGTYNIEKKAKLPGAAYNIMFRFDKKTLVLRDNGSPVISRFGLKNCNLEIGLPRDLSASGCGLFSSIKDYGYEYNIISLDKGVMQLGAQPADNNLSTEALRPTALGQAFGKD